MSKSLYPINDVKDFSELLFHFEKALNQVIHGDSIFSIQLRDVPIFRRIKSKIEHLPFLKEIFSHKVSHMQTMIRQKSRMTISDLQLHRIDHRHSQCGRALRL